MKERLPTSQDGHPYEWKIPKEKAEQMSLLWGEGSPALTELIKYCILNDIRTSASCKGHAERSGNGYIMFQKMPKEFYKYISEYMRKNFQGNYNLIVFREGKGKPKLQISKDGMDNERFFETILESVESYSKYKENSTSEITFPGINDMIENIFSRRGINKWRICNKYGECIDERKILAINLYVIDPLSKILNFCKRSQMPLSKILNVPKRIRNMLKENNSKSDFEK